MRRKTFPQVGDLVAYVGVEAWLRHWRGRPFVFLGAMMNTYPSGFVMEMRAFFCIDENRPVYVSAWDAFSVVRDVEEALG